MKLPLPCRHCWARLRRFGRVFAPHIRTQWRLIVAGLAGLLAATLMRIVEPWPLKFVIDRIVETEAGGARVSIPWLSNLGNDALLLSAAAALVGIASVRAAASYASTIGFALAGNRALTTIRAALFDHLQSLSLRFHGKSRSGDMVVRMVGDVGMVQEIAVTAMLPLLGSMLVLAGMFAVMFWLDPVLALIASGIVPVLAMATMHRGGRIRRAAQRTRHQESALAAMAAESFSSIKTVQSLSLGGRFADAFSRQNRANLGEGVRVKRLSAGLERTVDVLVAVATAAVLWAGAHRVLGGHLSAGELLVFLFYLKGAFRPVRDLAKYSARLAKASAAADRIVELFETRCEVVDAADAKPLSLEQGRIQLSHVSFSYEPGKPALRDINLAIEPGQHVAIVGASGSGKSTLASLLLRLYEPDAGNIRIDGVDIRRVTLDSLRANCTTVLQDTVLFAGTVRENIVFGQGAADADRVEAAARLANAHDFISALPDGYDTHLGERGVNLSSGQRQRIAIARAAVRDAGILILDEPTTGLDRHSEHLVLQALQRLARGKTTLHITHRPDAAEHADRIIVIDAGSVVEDGTYAELVTARGAFSMLIRHTMDDRKYHAKQ